MCRLHYRSILILVCSLGLFLEARPAMSQAYKKYQRSGRLTPENYLLKSFNEKEDPVFSGNPQVIDLGVDLGVGSDCGKVNFEGTMKSTLKNLLDAKYFGNIGRDIVAGSPMLLTCYMSPTWCSILKHTQVSANFLSQMRLNQCALIDKYTDQRSEDYYRERQECVRKKIADNGGDLETAMDSCQNVYNVDLKNWAGSSSGERSGTSKLIESSTKWAGLTGGEVDKATDLVKSFVGDTVLTQGRLSIEYGARGKALTPELHLKELQNGIHGKLCDDLMARIDRDGNSRSVDQIVTASDLKSLAPDFKETLIERQTIEDLAYLPPKQRTAACKRLSDTLALTVFTKDVNRSVDILAIATQNPNLPPERKSELEEKRRRLKESVDLTLELEWQRNDPLRGVLRDISEQGRDYRGEYNARAFEDDRAMLKSERAREAIFDCSDGILCKARR